MFTYTGDNEFYLHRWDMKLFPLYLSNMKPNNIKTLPDLFEETVDIYAIFRY